MGIIIRNGVDYGGGGGNSKEAIVTQEEYDALGDKVLEDGVTYYITDGVEDPRIEVKKVTAAQYEAIPGHDSDGIIYLITDEDGDTTKATNIKYDNAGTGLQSNNVQGAITELNSTLEGKIKYRDIQVNITNPKQWYSYDYNLITNGKPLLAATVVYWGVDDFGHTQINANLNSGILWFGADIPGIIIIRLVWSDSAKKIN